MQLDLHRAVRETYREAMARGSTSRQAFDLAVDLVRVDAPELTPHQARNLVAAMLCWDPGLPVILSREDAN